MAEVQVEVKKEEFWTMDYCDFDSLVKKVYGHDFEIVAAQELNNDSCAEFTVAKRQMPEDDEWAKKGWHEWKEEGKYEWGTTSQIFDDLCFNGFIPEGRYLIRVCW